MIPASEPEGTEWNLVVEQVVHAKGYMTALSTKVFGRQPHWSEISNADYKAHEKWIPIGPQGLDEVETDANSPLLRGELDHQTL